METPKSIKRITYYKDKEKELSIIKTDDNELLFVAHQIFTLTDANEVLNDPYVLINDDNMITLDKEKFSNLLDITAKVYNDEGVIIENDPVKFFWSNNRSIKSEPIIFIDESGLDDILFNLVTFDYSDVSNWIESMISKQEYNIPKNEETNSSNKLTKIKGAAYLGGNYLDNMGLTDIPVIVDNKDTPWFDLISVLDYIDIDKNW